MNFKAYKSFTDSLDHCLASQVAPMYNVLESDNIGSDCVCLLKRDEFTDSRLPTRSPDHTFAIYEIEILDDGSFAFDDDAPLWYYHDRWTADGNQDLFGPNPSFGTLSYEEAVKIALDKYHKIALELYRDFVFEEA